MCDFVKLEFCGIFFFGKSLVTEQSSKMAQSQNNAVNVLIHDANGKGAMFLFFLINFKSRQFIIYSNGGIRTKTILLWKLNQ